MMRRWKVYRAPAHDPMAAKHGRWVALPVGSPWAYFRTWRDAYDYADRQARGSLTDICLAALAAAEAAERAS